MPAYSYKCPRCGAEYERSSLKAWPCTDCKGWGYEVALKRDYRADGVGFAAVPQATFIPSVGAEVSDQRQMDEHLRRITRETEDRMGYTPKLRARHPSELRGEMEASRDLESDASKDRKRRLGQ